MSVGPVDAHYANLQASLSAGYAPTRFYFEYGRSLRYGQCTAPDSVDGCDNDYGVASGTSELESGTTYYVRLVAINKFGTSDGPTTRFTTPGAARPGTPPHPLLLLKPARTTNQIDQNLGVTIRLLGRFSPTHYVKLYYATPPYRNYHLAGRALPSSGGIVHMFLYFPKRPWTEYGPPPDRNVRLRARVDSSTSNTAQVYVVPQVLFSAYRESSGSSPYLEVQLSEDVHHAHRYPRPMVFFYRRTSRHQAWTLFAKHRLKPEGESEVGEWLESSFQFYDTRRVAVLFCLRHQIFRDMGRPFFFGACGRPRLR